VRCVTADENAPVAKPVGNHAPACPVLLAENVEFETGLHAKDLSDAVIAVKKR
jgi:hypothetical protein